MSMTTYCSEDWAAWPRNMQIMLFSLCRMSQRGEMSGRIVVEQASWTVYSQMLAAGFELSEKEQQLWHDSVVYQQAAIAPTE